MFGRNNAMDFKIENGVLIKYLGSDSNVVIPEGVKVIGKDAFFMCEEVERVVIPFGVTKIDNGAFNACIKLKSITIPNTVSTIGYYVFEGCESLESVVIPESVTKIGTCAFYCCDSISNIYVERNNPTYKSIDGNLYTKDGRTLIQYALGKKDDSFTIPATVNYVEGGAFCGAYNLSTLIIESAEIEIDDESLGNIDGSSDIKRIVICKGVKSATISRNAFADSEDYPSIYVEHGVDFDDFEDDWNGGLPVYDSRTNKLLIAADID